MYGALDYLKYQLFEYVYMSLSVSVSFVCLCGLSTFYAANHLPSGDLNKLELELGYANRLDLQVLKSAKHKLNKQASAEPVSSPVNLHTTKQYIL